METPQNKYPNSLIYTYSFSSRTILIKDLASVPTILLNLMTPVLTDFAKIFTCGMLDQPCHCLIPLGERLGEFRGFSMLSIKGKGINIIEGN
jgi:hypothetical protein